MAKEDRGMAGGQGKGTEPVPARGLSCPVCGGKRLFVCFTRQDVKRIRRTRECSSCGCRIVSVETVCAVRRKRRAAVRRGIQPTT